MMCRKSEFLKEAYVTCRARLDRKLIFSMAGRLGMLSCYRCGKPIESIENFSVDHKEPWLDVSSDLFWDIDNIAFSHRPCNSKAQRLEYKRKPIRHGTPTGYDRKCRCTACIEAKSRKRTERRLAIGRKHQKSYKKVYK